MKFTPYPPYLESRGASLLALKLLVQQLEPLYLLPAKQKSEYLIDNWINISCFAEKKKRHQMKIIQRLEDWFPDNSDLLNFNTAI